MTTIKVIHYTNIDVLLGQSVKLQLKGEAKPFYFKITGIRSNGLFNSIINGIDDEGLNLSIDVSDIEHVIGGI